MSLRLPLYASLLLLSLPAFAATQKVDLDYRVRFLPESNQAEVSITLEKGDAPLPRPAQIETGAGPVAVFDPGFPLLWRVRDEEPRP